MASRSLALISKLTRTQALTRLRPLSTAVAPLSRPLAASRASRTFSTRPATSSLNDSSPNWSNRPPKETILLDGCDFEHWLVVVDPPDTTWTRDQIIDSYIKKLAEVLGSEDEARKQIYSVSTKHYFAFGCIVSEELSYKIKALEKVRWVLPDSYLDVRNKDYGGEPFIDGQAVPYDPKYHEEWVRNNARANERSRRNDRPRNFDRSRNFERRRENMQGGFPNREEPPMQNQGFQNPPPQQNGTPPSPPPPPNAGFQNQMPPQGQNQGFMPPQNARPPPPPNAGYPNQMPPPPPNAGYPNQMPPSPPNAGYQNQMPPPVPNQGFQNRMPPQNVTAPPPHPPPAGGYPNQMPNSNFQGGPPGHQGYQGGGQGYQGVGGGQGFQANNQGFQGGPSGYQGNNAPNYNGPNHQGGGNINYPTGGPGYQGGNGNYQGGGPSNSQPRDLPGRD